MVGLLRIELTLETGRANKTSAGAAGRANFNVDTAAHSCIDEVYLCDVYIYLLQFIKVYRLRISKLPVERSK